MLSHHADWISQVRTMSMLTLPGPLSSGYTL